MGSFVITLREGFEAALIISLILAYLAKTDRLHEHVRSVWLGVAAGVVASVVAGAILFASAGELEGDSEALYEGTAMIAAAAVVTWMAFWMRRQAATIGRHLREQISESLRTGGGVALASVAFIGVAGLVTAVVLGVLFYRGALRMNLSRFFLVTSVLIIAFAAFLIFSGIHELGEVVGSEALELAGPLAALVYGAGFATLYVRDARRPAASRPAEPEPQPETPA